MPGTYKGTHMSDSNKPHFPKIQIRNRAGAEGQLSTGGNVELLLDGKHLGSAYFCKFEVHSRKIAKVIIEMYAEIDIDANLSIDTTNVEETDLVLHGKPLAIHTLSSYGPTMVTKKT